MRTTMILSEDILLDARFLTFDVKGPWSSELLGHADQPWPLAAGTGTGVFEPQTAAGTEILSCRIHDRINRDSMKNELLSCEYCGETPTHTKGYVWICDYCGKRAVISNEHDVVKCNLKLNTIIASTITDFRNPRILTDSW